MITGALLPIGDDNRGVRRPSIVVKALVLLNVVIFIYMLTLDASAQLAFVHRWGTIPYEIINLTDISPEIGWPIPVTIITGMFLHGGLVHLAGNMLFLWIFGDNIEDVTGSFGFLVFYLLCGIGATFGQILVDTSSLTPIVGASGAISGVLGAYLLLFPRGLVRVATFFVFIPILFRLPALIVIGMWFIFQLFSGYVSIGITDVDGGVAYFAHIAGFIAGLILVWVFADRHAVERHRAATRY